MKQTTKRSGRLKKQKEYEEAEAAKKMLAEVDLAWPRGINTTGLPTLPDELLLEILSYYPPIRVPTVDHNIVDTVAHIARRDTLLALAKTCSNLRRFFRPYVWQRIEVCGGMMIGKSMLIHGTPYKSDAKQRNKEFAVELIRQLEIVTIRDPTLSEHVHIVNIEITDFSVHSVFVELGRCLALFPNLHTVKIRKYPSSMSDMAARCGFQKYSYPQIRSAMLSPTVFPLLESCPQLQSVHCFNDTPYASRDFLRCLHNSPLLTDVQCVFDLHCIPEAAKLLPNIRHITLLISWWHGNIEALDCLLSFEKLQSIFLQVQSFGLPRDEIVAHIRNILLTLQKRDNLEKRLMVGDHGGLPSENVTIILPEPRRKGALGLTSEN